MNPVFINYPLETFTPTQSGALATVIWECCRIAQSEGVAPTVITSRSPSPTFGWPNLVQIAYPAVSKSATAQRFWRAQRRLTGWRHLRHAVWAARVAQAIRQHRLEDRPLILMNDPETTVYLRRRFPKSTLVHWFHNQLECRSRFRTAFAGAADIVCAVSDYTGAWTADYYAVKNVKTLYNGTDMQQFRPAETAAIHASPVINFVGRTGIEKGPDILLDAALQLSESTDKFGLQLLGSNHWDRFELDDYQRLLNEKVQRLEARGITVHRPGHVGRPDLPNAMRNAQIHVVPARWDEPFGLTTLEGMACGLATVASRTGGTPEVVGDGGWLFDRENVTDLTNRLRQLVTDPDLRCEQGRRARQRAVELPWSKTWNQLKTLTES